MRGALICLVILVFNNGCSCRDDVLAGYQVTLAVPPEYSEGFIGRAFLIESDQNSPTFRAALSVEAISGQFSCSLQVFLGDFKVWNSDHFSTFYTSERCVLELTDDGDLRLKGQKDRVGWRTGTSSQGVKRLRILPTGNLVLVDSSDGIKWQSFNFPTDIMLWGQSLNVATRLTSFPNPNNSNSFFSFEIQTEKIGLYLNSAEMKYSYWQFKPSNGRNISFIKLGSKGLQVFNEENKKIAEILPKPLQPLRFLALGNRTGNLGLYFYLPEKAVFEASFQALNETCDLPLACKPYGICTFSNSCSCLGLQSNDKNRHSFCDGAFPAENCSKEENEMLELKGVSSILREAPKRVNVSKEECANLCLEDCKCSAALHSSENPDEECSLYRFVMGAKQMESGNGLSYMVKVPKGSNLINSKSKLKKWVILVVGIADGLIILLVFGGVGYYVLQKRRKRLLGRNNNT